MVEHALQLILFNCCHGCTKSLTCLVCFLQNAVTSVAKRKAKLKDDCCVGESQDIEERDSFQEAHEKKTCDRKRYKADPESKKDSMKAQYWHEGLILA